MGTFEFASRRGDKREGWLEVPDGRVLGGVVALQEFWGVNDQMKKVATRFSAAGFLTAVPDLYHGPVANTREEAMKLMRGLDTNMAVDDIAGAVKFLKEDTRTTGKVAVVGFCLGGALAFRAGVSIDGLAAIVPFYGIAEGIDLSTIRAPVLAHFSKSDDWAKPRLAEGAKRAIERAGGRMTLHVYDAPHAFMNEARPEVYSPTDAALAWERTLGFLREQFA